MKWRARWAWRFIGFVISTFLIYEIWFAGRILILRWVDPKNTSFMIAYAEESNNVPKHIWVDYENISPQVKKAVLASEDARFIHHGGFDWTALRHAASRNVRQGKIISGGSTITQQLAKNLFLSPSRSIWRKGQEAILALMLEVSLSKQRIFEVYLNIIEWGQGVYGIEAAANHYFNRTASDLSGHQAAKLASYIPAPRKHFIVGDTDRSLRKAKIIRGRMTQIKVPTE
ncbi:MAG: monofunctional biosynthetic peptidoglycan transglycosylase [Burkholderiales bacterium]|nr:MAG: monofunctional biosynthetic peptidoglycan transglycosylase [Betaproteobacteria bacterium TMED22]|tara:strand:+ start:578 stop:1264 length:687 start_codon:yes stop_codon:yes gene_type:complete